jgi:hypothetical protein
MKTIQERLDDTDQKLHTNINSVEKQRNEIISRIEGIEQEFFKHIRKLKHKALEALNSDFTLVKDEIETNVSQISKVKQEIEQANNQLQTADSMNIRQQFVQTKLVQQTVNNALKVFKQSEAKGCQFLRFTENTKLKSLIIASTSLGSVRKTTENNSQVALKLYKVISQKVNIRMKNDRYQCYISDICQLADGTIILADRNNMKLKRLDVNYDINDCLDLESYPTGICCTGNTEVAVKLHNNKVWFISVGSSLSKVRDISVTCGGYWGMTYCDGELWVSDGNGVNAYSMTGTLIKSSVRYTVNGQHIFKSSQQQMAVSGDTVIVTDYSDGAVCLNRDMTVKRELRDKRLVWTRGVCVANNGTVFISGYSSNNIMMFDRDSKCLGELVVKDAGLVNLTSMLYDDKKSCLIVACDPDKIIVYYT